MRWLLISLFLCGLSFWWLTEPVALSPGDLPEHDADPENGQVMFNAGGCVSCHGPELAGGLEMQTEFGTFIVPNISPDPDNGIGGWTGLQFVNAMMLGVSPRADHYYPAFPYTSYTRMKVQDVLDLKAYLDSFDAVSSQLGPHQLGFPWSLRRGIGLWKLRYLKQNPVVQSDPGNELVERGRYLAEGVGHCAECHTSRDRIGGLNPAHWLAGAPNPVGEGRVPNITSGKSGLGSWSESDIAYYLESGFTPDYDTVGSSMVEVQENMAKLPDSDRQAIAAYLKAIPAKPTAGK
jgi:mono/diheme cytochrome c family protein